MDTPRKGCYIISRKLFWEKDKEMSTTLDAPAWAVSETDLVRYEQDGFLVARQMFAEKEVAAIRDSFTQMAKSGPVEGLFYPKMGEDANGDPLARYPRVMHP